MAMTTLDEKSRIAYPERRKILLAVISAIGLWLRRSRTRRDLRALEMYRLTDIGLSERQRADECGKWFWQA